MGDDWREQASCASDPNPEHWFSSDAREVTRALAICRGCRAIHVCAEAADAEQEQHGIWGGTIRDPAVRGAVRRQEAAERALREAAEREAAQAAQQAAERQERRRAMHAEQRERLRLDPERYALYLDKARARMQRRREQQALEREQRREAWST